MIMEMIMLVVVVVEAVAVAVAVVVVVQANLEGGTAYNVYCWGKDVNIANILIYELYKCYITSSIILILSY